MRDPDASNPAAPPARAIVLFIAANPLPESALSLDEEYRAIDAKTQAASGRDALDFEMAPAARVGDLPTQLMRHAPTVLHFSGHGSKDPEGLVFVGTSDDSALMSTKALDSIFRVLRDNIRLVVLNACYSEAQAKAIAKHVECVVGMRKAIGDEAAITFAAAFYEAIAFGRSVQDAFDLGIASLQAHQIAEDRTPRLLAREGIDARRVFIVGPNAGRGAADELTGAARESSPDPNRGFAAAEREDSRRRHPSEREHESESDEPDAAEHADPIGTTRSAVTRAAIVARAPTDRAEQVEPRRRTLYASIATAALVVGGLSVWWFSRSHPMPAKATPVASAYSPEETAEQAAIIEATIRRVWQIPESKPLTPKEFARLEVLELMEQAITDAGVAWLADPARGLVSLRGLGLAHTEITDAALAEITREGSGLVSLESLHLNATRVTDQGLALLADDRRGLKALRYLVLADTSVGDAGAEAISRPTSALSRLDSLDLSSTLISDSGVRVLARPNTALKALTFLGLWRTNIGDEAAIALAANDTGLANLHQLSLGETRIGNAGVAALASKDSGIRRLRVLELQQTRVGDAGAGAIVSPTSALKSLTILNLNGTRLTDDGMAALIAKDSPLSELQRLDAADTSVGDRGVLSLASPDSGLAALVTLGLHGTKVSPEAIRAIRKSRPNVLVYD